MSDDKSVEIPKWQLWVLPDRPGMTHFLLGALCLVLPVAAIVLGTRWILPAMGVAATLGGGLGLGWLLACSAAWLRVAPVTSICVLCMTLGCLGHLYLMPRLEVWLRFTATIEEVGQYQRIIAGGGVASLPSYNAGLSWPRLRQIEHAGEHSLVLYTPEPFQRWTLFGYTDSSYLAFYGDGRKALVLKNRDQLDKALSDGR
jgi:hypothetical protein